jgi:hypothetical protein
VRQRLYLAWRGSPCADARRALMSEAPLRRSIIRHMFIILDLSDSMRDKDFRPNR